MKHYFVLGAAVCVALSMVSCKSSESAYKKAYEKAKQQQTVSEAPTAQSATQPTTVAPVQTVTTTPVSTNETSTRSENLTLVSGAGLKAYSVVVGSFSIKANAEALQKKLNNAGYAAQIATNPQGMYRVIASTFDSLDSAVQSRNTLRTDYKDAWLLRK